MVESGCEIKSLLNGVTVKTGADGLKTRKPENPKSTHDGRGGSPVRELENSKTRKLVFEFLGF